MDGNDFCCQRIGDFDYDLETCLCYNTFWIETDVLESRLCYMKVYDKQNNFRNNSYIIPLWYTCNSNIKFGNKSVLFK